MKDTKSFIKILYFLSALCFMGSLFAGEMNIYASAFGTISDVLMRFMFALVLAGSVLSLWGSVYTYPICYVVFFFITAVYWDLSYYKCTVELIPSERFNALTGLIALNISLLIWSINYIRLRILSGISIQQFSAYKKYIPLAIICITYFLLFLLNYNVWFHMDSRAYYSSVAENAGTWKFRLADMSSLRMGGHTSYAYTILLMIGELLVPDLGYGQRMVNCILSIVTIIAFYFITEKIWGQAKRTRSVLLTIIFAFAPLFYGISYLVSSDFPLLCFFTLLLCATFYKISFLKFIMVLCVCFSKETGVFILAGLYLGETIVNWIKKSKKLGDFFWQIFDLKKLIIYSSAFLYALILFCGNGGWIQNFKNILMPPANIPEMPTNTYIWWHYPIFKIFEYFFMNYYWLIWPLLLVALLLIIIHCKKENRKMKEYIKGAVLEYLDYYIPIIIAYLFFCIIGIAYLTYIHYRYVQLGHLFYVLCLGMIIDIVPLKYIKRELLLLPIAFFMTVQSFVAIDPVTYLFFKDFDAGNGKIVSTRQYWYITVDEKTGSGYYWEADDPTMSQHYLAEGTEYNRETIGLQRVMENALQSIGYSSNMLIVLDVFGGWDSWTSAQIFGNSDYSHLYWDQSLNTIVSYETDIPLNLAFDSNNLADYMDHYSQVYYIEFPFNQYHQNTVLVDWPAINHFDVSHMRWEISVYQLK